jgi:hypothetical protein
MSSGNIKSNKADGRQRPRGARTMVHAAALSVMGGALPSMPKRKRRWDVKAKGRWTLRVDDRWALVDSDGGMLAQAWAEDGRWRLEVQGAAAGDFDTSDAAMSAVRCER